jgi:enoyl-[acyl-carrier protein] reductase I
MGILEGKKILVTGVLTEASIAFSVARLAQEEGAEVILSSFGRMLPITTKIAERLPKPAPVIELDATNDTDLKELSGRISAHADSIDGIVHAIAFAPQTALGGNFLETEWPDVSTAVEVSAYSLKSITMAAKMLGGQLLPLELIDRCVGKFSDMSLSAQILSPPPLTGHSPPRHCADTFTLLLGTQKDVLILPLKGSMTL